MKPDRDAIHVTATAAGLERIKVLEEQLAHERVGSHERRALNARIQIEADAYRKSLDAEQAVATHDRDPGPL